MLTTTKEAVKMLNNQSSFVRYIRVGKKAIVFWDALNIPAGTYDRGIGEISKPLPKNTLSRAVFQDVLNINDVVSTKTFGPFRYIKLMKFM